MTPPAIIIGLAIVGIAIHMLFFTACGEIVVRNGCDSVRRTHFFLTTPEQVGKLRNTF